MKRTAFKALKTFIALALVMAMTLGLAASAASNTCSFQVNPEVGVKSEITMTWDDAYLDGPTTVYNAALAKFCMDAASADVSDPAASKREDVCQSRMDNIKAVYEGVGFNVVKQDYYIKGRSIADHVTAYTVAKKSAVANGKNVTVYLVAIHPNGVGEVMSDFDIAAPVSGGAKEYDTNLVYPFTKTADIVNAEVISQVGSDENVRFIIAGESRGGGAANYLAKLLTDEYGPHRVQAYTYSTPNVAKVAEADANSSYYNNIFNIINPEDIVPCLPLESWGFSRYGRTLLINAETLAAKGGSTSVANIYKKYSKHSFVGYNDNGTAVQALIDKFESLAPTVEDYYTKKYPAYKEYKYAFGSAVATGNTVELSTYEFIQYVFGILDLFSGIDMSGNLLSAANKAAGDILVLYEQLKSIDKDSNNAFNPILKAILIHAFGCKSLDELLKIVGILGQYEDNLTFSSLVDFVFSLMREYGTDFDAMFGSLGDKMPQKEGVAAHILYGYRAYTESAGGVVKDLYSNKEMLDGSSGEISDEDWCAELKANNAFFADMTLTCDVTEGYNETEVYADFDLALSVETSKGKATPLEPNGPVTVYLDLWATENLSEDLELTLTVAETGEEIEFEVDNGFVVFRTDALGIFRVSAAKPTETKIVFAENDGEKVTVKVTVNETAANRIILAGYTSNGKMTGIKTWVATADKPETVAVDTFLPDTSRLKLFITTGDYLEALSDVKPFTVN